MSGLFWTAILFSNAGFPQLLYFCNHPVCALIFRKPSSDEPWMMFHTSGKKKATRQTCLNEFFPSTFNKTHTEHCKLALIHHFEVSFSRALKLLWLIAWHVHTRTSYTLCALAPAKHNGTAAANIIKSCVVTRRTWMHSAHDVKIRRGFLCTCSLKGTFPSNQFHVMSKRRYLQSLPCHATKCKSMKHFLGSDHFDRATTKIIDKQSYK